MPVLHYCDYPGDYAISKNNIRLIHNLVDTAKSFLRNGKSSGGRTFHCCFVIEHGKVMEIGFNSYRHEIDYVPRLGKVKKYADKNYKMCKHAEVDAILKMGNVDFSKSIFLNVHIDKNFKCRVSRPCKNCMRMMAIVGVKRCWYFNENSNQWVSVKPRSDE